MTGRFLQRQAPPAANGWTASAVAGQSGEVLKNAGDELLPARVLSVGGEDFDKVPHLLGKLGPGRRRRREEKFLKLRLARFQGRLIDLNLLEAPTNLRGFLGSHAPVPVEFDRIVCHGRSLSFRPPSSTRHSDGTECRSPSGSPPRSETALPVNRRLILADRSPDSAISRCEPRRRRRRQRKRTGNHR